MDSQPGICYSSFSKKMVFYNIYVYRGKAIPIYCQVNNSLLPGVGMGYAK